MTRRKQFRSLSIESLSQRLVLDGMGLTEPLFFEPTPYLSVEDTPAAFNPDPDCDSCVTGLEDFEDGLLDPGLQIPQGSIIDPDFGTGVPRLTDSVDGDDGTIDGSGQTDDGGYSWFFEDNTIEITLPGLMQSAGVVWTDGATELTDVIFEAFDQDGNSLGTVNAGDIADDSAMGTTAEDRFFGVSFGDGVSTGVTRISITNVGGSGIEIDHIQWANCSACCVDEALIDVELTKTVDRDTAEVGETVTWNLTVTNNAAAETTATEVAVGDILPEEVTLVEANASGNGVVEVAVGVAIWNLTDALAPGESATLEVVTLVNDDVPIGTSIVNTAQVVFQGQRDVDSQFSNDDGDQSEDDEDAATVTVVGSSVDPVIDLELTKTVDSETTVPGATVTWTISLTNNAEQANTAATGVIVSDLIPAGVSLVDSMPSGNGSFEVVVGIGVWSLIDPLEPGETATLVLETMVDDDLDNGTSITNVGQVVAQEQTDVDSAPANDNGDQSEDDEDAARTRVVVAEPLMISGSSYVDANNDGVRQSDEMPLKNVEIQLMGTDDFGNDVNLTTFTDENGDYKFNDVAPGSYMVKQVQPAQMLDGKDTLGNLGGDGSVNDKFTITITDTSAEDYNFAERGLLPQFVNKRLFFSSAPIFAESYIDVGSFGVSSTKVAAAVEEVSSPTRRWR